MTERQFKTITKKLHFYNQGGIKNLCTMTEATLRQIMEEAAGVTQAYIRKLVQHDIDQQNKIALLSAKVYKLQKENAKVEEIKANADYQLEGRDNEIAELKDVVLDLLDNSDESTRLKALNCIYRQKEIKEK